jgi:hypothetical protein
MEGMECNHDPFLHHPITESAAKHDSHHPQSKVTAISNSLPLFEYKGVIVALPRASPDPARAERSPKYSPKAPLARLPKEFSLIASAPCSTLSSPW